MQFGIVFLEHFFLPSLPRSCQALMVLELFGINSVKFFFYWREEEA